MFSTDNDPKVLFDDEKSEFSMPKIFEDETKFCEPISENVSKFIQMGCTKKADIKNNIEEMKIPEHCTNIIPPMINSEIWNKLFPNVQQRDKTFQEVQKAMGLSIVPMME